MSIPPRRSARRGNQAIEFALLTPFLLALVAATVDWGYFWHAKFHMVNALHVGARSAATTGADNTPNPLTIATDVASATFTESGVSVTPVFTSGFNGTDPDTVVWVQGEAPFTAFIGFIPTPANVTHAVHMRMVDQSTP